MRRDFYYYIIPIDFDTIQNFRDFSGTRNPMIKYI